MPEKKAKRKPFNFLMSPEEYAMCETLAKQESVSQGAILRRALRARYLHVVQGVPTCASDTPCYVPQMHGAHMRASILPNGMVSNG